MIEMRPALDGGGFVRRLFSGEDQLELVRAHAQAIVLAPLDG